MSSYWLPQRREVKQIEFLFKLAVYGFDPLETSSALAGRMHATFQPPPAARGAVLPLAHGEPSLESGLIPASLGLPLAAVNSLPLSLQVRRAW